MFLLVVVKIMYDNHLPLDVLVSVFALALGAEALALYSSFSREERMRQAVCHHARNNLQTTCRALETLGRDRSLERTERLLIDMALDTCEILTVSAPDEVKSDSKDSNYDLKFTEKTKKSNLSATEAELV